MSDACAFYKQVQSVDAVETMRKSFAEVEQLAGRNTVTIVKTKSVGGHIGGHTPLYFLLFWNTIANAFVDCLSFFAATIRILFIQVETSVFCLATVPIGNFWGKAAVSAVAGWHELISE